MDIRNEIERLEDLYWLEPREMIKELDRIVVSLKRKSVCKCGNCNRGCQVKG